MTIDDTQTLDANQTENSAPVDDHAPAQETQPEPAATTSSPNPVDQPQTSEESSGATSATEHSNADADPEPTMPQPEEPAASTESEPTQEAMPVEPEPTSAVTTVKDDGGLFDEYMSALDSGEETDIAHKTLRKGERIDARIVQVEEDKVFVDLGTKSDGVVYLNELSKDEIGSAKDHFKVGDRINVIVIKGESSDGNPIASKKQAEFEENWDHIEKAFKDGTPLAATVVERVKGGLVVDVGVRGFVPATHVGSGKLRNIEKYVGQEVQLKVIDIDRERKKVVLSNREAEETLRASARDELFDHAHVDDIVEGTIRRLTDYGAFVDLGGMDGLLHISEMSWSRINHPKEMFKEGQTIKVKILKLDKAAGKISLGHRQVLPDPWHLIKDNYQINQIIKVKITRLASTGAFIKLPEGAEAFMPLSEMSSKRIRTPQEAVEEGAEIEARILDLKPDQRRMVLSLREPGSSSYESQRTYATQSDDFGSRNNGGKNGPRRGKKRGGRDNSDDHGDQGRSGRSFSQGGATIGERLGALRGFFRRVEDEAEMEDSQAGASASDSKNESASEEKTSSNES